jgi:hypothetical protein
MSITSYTKVKVDELLSAISAAIAGKASPSDVAAAVAGRAVDSTVVHLAGAETVGGVKTFTSPPLVPTPTAPGQASPKSYVDGALAALVGSAPATMDTLQEIAALLAADESAAGALAATVAGKQDKSTLGADVAGNATVRAAFGSYVELAAIPETIIAGTITRDANGTATAAPVKWPDGTAGLYTATTVSSAFPGAVDAYTITYGSPATRTFTQPAVTRDANGAVTQRPALVVS